MSSATCASSKNKIICIYSQSICVVIIDINFSIFKAVESYRYATCDVISYCVISLDLKPLSHKFQLLEISHWFVLIFTSKLFSLEFNDFYRIRLSPYLPNAGTCPSAFKMTTKKIKKNIFALITR